LKPVDHGKNERIINNGPFAGGEKDLEFTQT